jgi:hypothetical protein
MNPSGTMPIGEYLVACGERFRGGWKVDRNRSVCACRRLYSAGVCVACGRDVCDEHGQFWGNDHYCFGCVRRIDADTAYKTVEPYFRELAAIAGMADPIERLVRWCRVEFVAEYMPAGRDRTAVLREIFPDAFEPGAEPGWRDDEVIAWFLRRASALGLKPEPTYRTWVARRRLFYGEDLVAGPLRAAWHLSGGAQGPLLYSQSAADAYVLTDGSVMLDNNPVTGERPAKLNTRGLAALADLLGA